MPLYPLENKEEDQVALLSLYIPSVVLTGILFLFLYPKQFGVTH